MQFFFKYTDITRVVNTESRRAEPLVNTANKISVMQIFNGRIFFSAANMLYCSETRVGKATFLRNPG